VNMVLVRLVEFRFKDPPGTTSSYISITSSGQRNRASWASQTQKSVTLLPCQEGRPRSPQGHVGAWGEKNMFVNMPHRIQKCTNILYEYAIINY